MMRRLGDLCTAQPPATPSPDQSFFLSKKDGANEGRLVGGGVPQEAKYIEH
jgi:hypothetical protein